MAASNSPCLFYFDGCRRIREVCAIDHFHSRHMKTIYQKGVSHRNDLQAYAKWSDNKPLRLRWSDQLLLRRLIRWRKLPDYLVFEMNYLIEISKHPFSFWFSFWFPLFADDLHTSRKTSYLCLCQVINTIEQALGAGWRVICGRVRGETIKGQIGGSGPCGLISHLKEIICAWMGSVLWETGSLLLW